MAKVLALWISSWHGKILALNFDQVFVKLINASPIFAFLFRTVFGLWSFPQELADSLAAQCSLPMVVACDPYYDLVKSSHYRKQHGCNRLENLVNTGVQLCQPKFGASLQSWISSLHQIFWNFSFSCVLYSPPSNTHFLSCWPVFGLFASLLSASLSRGCDA